MRNLIPEFVKPLIRFFHYPNERKRVCREIGIRKEQNKLIGQLYPTHPHKLIVFIVEGADWFTGEDTISGGIISICSIYEETLRLKEIHQSEVIMVTRPEALLLARHTKFDNDIPVFRFSQLGTHFKQVDHILFHVADGLTFSTLFPIFDRTLQQLNVQDVHLNILNQRIDNMPDVETIRTLKGKGYYLTQTTAHERYSTLEIRNRFEIPLHKLSVFATPERYKYHDFDQKDDLILISPDKGRLKDQILAKLKQEMTGYTIQVIQNLTYSQYLRLVEKARFTLTFGEGLDFYLIETVFSGGVAFAEMNDRFFTADFQGVPGLFDSYEQMLDEITLRMKQLLNKENYLKTNELQFAACHKIYNGNQYRQNLVNFYKHNYLFP